MNTRTELDDVSPNEHFEGSLKFAKENTIVILQIANMTLLIEHTSCFVVFKALFSATYLILHGTILHIVSVRTSLSPQKSKKVTLKTHEVKRKISSKLRLG